MRDYCWAFGCLKTEPEESRRQVRTIYARFCQYRILILRKYLKYNQTQKELNIRKYWGQNTTQLNKLNKIAHLFDSRFKIIFVYMYSIVIWIETARNGAAHVKRAAEHIVLSSALF